MSAAPAARPEAVETVRAVLAAIDAGADHFGVLQLPANAPPAAVRDQYFRMAKFVHPDLPQFATSPRSRDEATRAFQAITAAHSVLSDPARRQEYVESLRRSAELEQPAQPTDGGVGLAVPPNAEVARIYLHRGRQQLGRRDWAGAQEALELASRVLEDKDLADCKVMLGWAVFNNTRNAEADRIERARALWSEVAETWRDTPHQANASYYLAVWHKLHGEMKKVGPLLDKCLSIDPRHIEAAREKRLLERRRSTGSFPEVKERLDRDRRTSRSAVAASTARRPTGQQAAQKVPLDRKPGLLERLFGRFTK